MKPRLSEKFGLPPFERIPFRSPENATYRIDVPPSNRGNPAYEAVPGPRSESEQKRMLTAHNPVFDPTDRLLPTESRRELLKNIYKPFFALPCHATLERMMMTTIRNSYEYRNPCSPLYMEKAIARVDTMCLDRCNLGACNDLVGSGSVTGDSGGGKSCSIKRILMLGCPQIALHRSYKGLTLGIQQLLWLYVPCPPKASIAALAAWIAASLDRIFGTDVLEAVETARNDSARWRIIGRALALHITGVVVIDELQNLAVGQFDHREALEKALQELINTTFTRFIFVGTPEVDAIIRSPAMIRRMVGEEGQISWRLSREEWESYLSQLWKWQYTKTPTPLDGPLRSVFWELTEGIPDYANKLWTRVQSLLIGHRDYPNELITPDVVRYAMQSSFPRPHQLITTRRRQQPPSPPTETQTADIEARTSIHDSLPVNLPETTPELPELQQAKLTDLLPDA